VIKRRPAGFTLVEVMVALVIGGMVISAAAGLLTSLGDRAKAIERAAASADEDANAERQLRTLVANLAPAGDTTHPVIGNGDSVVFRAWCDTAARWLDHCDVRLFFNRRDSVTTLNMELGSGYISALELRRDVRRGRLRYLTEVDHRLQWRDAWSERYPPTALAVVIESDTLLFPVAADD
jgi:prepilin-type N-terminal cleavage/methylation domain-containing protein